MVLRFLRKEMLYNGKANATAMQALYNSEYSHIFKGPVQEHVTYRFGDLQATYANIPHIDVQTSDVTQELIYKTANMTCSSLLNMHGMTPETDAELWVIFYKLFSMHEGHFHPSNAVSFEVFLNKLTTMYEEIKARDELLASINFALGMGYFYMAYFVMYNHKKGNPLNFLHELCHVIHRLVDQVYMLELRNLNNRKIQEFSMVVRDVLNSQRVSQFYDYSAFCRISAVTQIVANILCGCPDVCRQGEQSLHCQFLRTLGLGPSHRSRPVSPPATENVMSLPAGSYVNQTLSIRTRFPGTGPELFKNTENVVGIVPPPTLYHVTDLATERVKMCLKHDFYMTEFYNNKESNNYILPVQSTPAREQQDMAMKLFNNVVFGMYLACQVRQIILSQWKILLSLFRNQIEKLIELLPACHARGCMYRLAYHLDFHTKSFGAIFKEYVGLVPELLLHAQNLQANDSESLRANIIVEYLIDDKFSPEIPGFENTYLRMARDYRFDILRGNRNPFPMFTLDLSDARNLVFSNEAFHTFYNVIPYDDIIPNYSSF
ncbi:protein U4 [Elephant endotheliotropic herpesvirus 3A]|uniref:Protein U4 n=1 Tax=Elephant endotheliotropic herpesvirus 3A TaxID=1329409 RepID=A0A866VSS4_9BETA|nr:protein U4 [Elephant endotheliotropic herpesvirus 3A]QOE74414.1 protein U4 [Elephant endotheliotropic herpesvirus 3A]